MAKISQSQKAKLEALWRSMPAEKRTALLATARAGKDADAANDFMMARGVIPRKIGAYGLPQMLRISIGTKEEMEICLQAIKDFVNA